MIFWSSNCCTTSGMLAIHALAAAGEIIIPMMAHYLSVKGMEQLIRTISNVKRKINPTLEIAGVLITMADMRTNYLREIIDLLHQTCDGHLRIFNSMISSSIESLVSVGMNLDRGLRTGNDSSTFNFSLLWEK